MIAREKQSNRHLEDIMGKFDSAAESVPSDRQITGISFKIGDWHCGKCHTHNFAKRSSCFRCMERKPVDADDHKPSQRSDYDSSKEGNARNKDGNYEGGDMKRKAMYNYPKGIRAKRGDWTCADESCRAVNFASRRSCFKCQKDKPPQPDEWECDSCGFQNKDFRRECLECGTKNKNPVTSSLREGDWNCSCGHYNFARRSDCQKCGCNKNDNETKDC